MFHIGTICPACSAGAVGFRRCSDGATIVMMCDECNAVWLRPEAISLESAIFPAAPDYMVDGLNCSVASPHGGWAGLEEIKKAKLERFIAGEGKALDE